MDKRLDYFTADDGKLIRYGIWPSRSGPSAGSVIYLEGRAEFIEKNTETFDELVNRGFEVYTFDWRGQGLSDRMLPNRHKGYVETFLDYVNDLSKFVDLLVEPFANKPLILLAHSMGGHIALRYLQEMANPISGAVLLSPMVDIRTHPLPEAFARALSRQAVTAGRRNKYVIGSGDYDLRSKRFFLNRLTSDRERFFDEVQMISKNPNLATGGATYGWLQASFNSIDILKTPGYVEQISTPVLMISGDKDRVVCRHSQEVICRRLPDCRFVDVKNAKHEILKETDYIRSIFWEHFDRFASQM